VNQSYNIGGVVMKEELFGTISYDGKMINLDKDNIEDLKKISSELKERQKNLEIKVENIFKQ
jgi:hypothetical protein